MSETTIKPYSKASTITGGYSTGVFIRTILVPLVMLSMVFGLWMVSLPRIDPSKMNDLGLVSVLPATFFISLGVLATSYMISVHQKGSNEFILLLHLLLLIFIIHGTPQIVYGTVRYSWAWKHAGIVDYIQRNGSVNPSITNLNAYHNWPGFFALAAMYNALAGISNSISYAGWGPVFFNLIDLGALLVLFKALTNDRRQVWLSVWIYYLFSWVGQDYFSPQAFAYFLFLVCLALVVKWFRNKPNYLFPNINPNNTLKSKLTKFYQALVRHGTLEQQDIPQTTVGQRLFLMSALILTFFVIASSHQLTPLMLISALTILVIFQVTHQRFIPLLMAVITFIWIIYMAAGFLNGNLHWIVQSIGSLLDNVNGNLINLAVASHGQQFIARVDRLMSALVWMLGLAGFYRHYRSGKWDLPAILLALSPIPLLALNSYGGEMLFRVYMFGLPFMAFLAGSLFYPGFKARVPATSPLLSALLSLILIPGFLLSYYGKDRMYYFSRDEVAATQYLFNTAPKGSLIMDGIWDWPRQYTHYEDYNYQSILLLTPEERQHLFENPAQVLSQFMDVAAPGSVNINPAVGSVQEGNEVPPPGIKASQEDYPAAYLVITRSQIAGSEMTGTLPANWSTTIIASLAKSPNFKIEFSNQDAIIFQYIDTMEP